MVYYFIYAKDYSGSTEGDKHFHRNGLKSLQQFKHDVEAIQKEPLDAGEPPIESQIIYLHWGNDCFQVDENTTVTTYKKMASGNMGTQPHTIIEWIRDKCNICDGTDKIKLLYIITDGEIDTYNADRAVQLNQDIHYDKFVFHAFNEDINAIDLSVASAFVKSQCKIYRNYELLSDLDVSEEFDYDKINVNNFEAEIANLKSYIQLKFINKYKQDIIALHEIDKLKKLRDRLFDELASQSQKIKSNLDTMDREVFLREFVNTNWYKNLNAPVNDAKKDIEKAISTLINYIISDTKSFSFDALKYETEFNNSIEEETIVDVNFPTDQEIEFPDIILFNDKGIPVILLMELNLLDKIIFNRSQESSEISPASFKKFKSAMECPLFLCNDSDISESIGYFYTLNVYKQLLETNPKTEPRTRRTFHGGLVLIDNGEFDKYNDYILSATYFNFKKVNYNIGLFYYVLWKNCENKEWMDRNVVEQFKKYTMRRISMTVCRIGLSSLPLDPPEKTSLLTALWYCVELSSRIFKDDALNFMHERLRMHYGVAHSMIEILTYMDYDLDLDFIQKRKDLIRHVMKLKKMPTNKEKVYYLLERIFKNVNGFLVSEIEKPFNLNKLNYLKLNHKELLCDDIIKEEVHLNDYIHLMYVSDSGISKDGQDMFDLCDKTLRPFFTIDQSTSFYTELVRARKNVVINNDSDKNKISIAHEAINSLGLDKVVSFYNLLINCVKDSEKYPTLSEYIEYISRKKKYHDDLVTIFPPNVYINAEYVFSRYQSITDKFDVSEFIDVCKKYVSRHERIKAEGIFKFENDKDILKFICSEELKVNLKKSGQTQNTLIRTRKVRVRPSHRGKRDESVSTEVAPPFNDALPANDRLNDTVPVNDPMWLNSDAIPVNDEMWLNDPMPLNDAASFNEAVPFDGALPFPDAPPHHPPPARGRFNNRRRRRGGRRRGAAGKGA